MLADQTGIPLGSGAVTYNKYNGYLAAAGYSFGDQFRMIDPFLCKAPLAIVMLLYFMFIGLKISPDHPSTAITGVNLKARKRRCSDLETGNHNLCYIYSPVYRSGDRK